MVGANWRLENAKSPAAVLQENNPDATCMSIPRIYVPGICAEPIAGCSAVLAVRRYCGCEHR